MGAVALAVSPLLATWSHAEGEVPVGDESAAGAQGEVPVADEPAAGAQGEVVDRIVALVGDEVVLASEVDEELYLASLRGELDLTDLKAVAEHRKTVLDALVEGKILLEEARRQGIRVERAETDQALDASIADVRRRFPTEETFLRQIEKEGTSLEQLRIGQRAKIEEQLMVRQLVDRSVRSKVAIEDQEVREYWDAHRAEIPRVPARLDLSRILVSVRSSEAVDSAAVRRAEIVAGRLAAGEDFATLAKVFSEGPGAEQGGEIGWVRVSDLEPALAQAIEGLEPGKVTGVVLSGKGAHLLKVLEADPERGMRLAQIVFLRDEKAARASARARAEGILARLRSGESFETLAASDSDDQSSASKSGHVGLVAIESLEGPYQTALDNVAVGAISEIVEDQESFSIFRVNAREGERDATLDDVKERLTEILRNQRAKQLYDTLLAQAREKTYVETRLDETGS